MRELGSFGAANEVREEIPEAPLGRGGRIRLWLRYNLYMFLLVAGIGLVVGLAALGDVPWWLWVPVGLGAVGVGRFAWTIPARHPRKLRATRRAQTRILRGTFRTEQVVKYCGDPCSRLVATEILRRAGVAGPERRRVLRDGARQAQEEARQLVLVDRSRGLLVTVDGSTVHTQRLETSNEGERG